MKLTNGNLEHGSKHDDVREQLHPELLILGFVIPAAETDEGLFGDVTRRAVMEFQRDQGLPVTGVVDAETAALLNEQADAKQAARLVQGSVRLESGNPLANITVLAYAADLNQDELLGQAVTNQKGAYFIKYVRPEPSSATDAGLALRVRAVNRLGIILATSETRFKVTDNETIDIDVPPTKNIALSEYEELLEAIMPIAGDMPLAQLADEQLEFLAGSSAQNPDLIRVLVQATQLAQETRLLSPAVFYALLRHDLPVELDKLLETSLEVLERTLVNAIDARIVPARLEDNLEEIVNRLSELAAGAGVLATRSAAGRLLDRATGNPLPGFSISVAFPGGQEPLQDVATTTNDGSFSFAYLTPRSDVADQGHRLLFRITTPDGDQLPGVLEQTVTEGADPFDLAISAPPGPKPPTIDELNNQLNLNLPVALRNELNQRDIDNLDDLRQAGGLEGLGQPIESSGAAALEAHARLSILPTTVTENAAMINAGYSSPQAVAAATRVDFVGNVGGALGDLGAATAHDQGSIAANILDSYAADAVLDDWVVAPPGDGDPDLDLDSDIVDVFPAACQCHQCSSAVSPAAYLADLLAYVTENLKRIPQGANNGPLVSVDDLADRFHQPFGDLPASCTEVERIVRQIRICIEVLRRFLDEENLPAAGSSEESALNLAHEQYLEQAYQSILGGLGTSYAELRDSQSADLATRELLAIRLGLDPQQLNRLNELFLAPGVLDEDVLERLFGLAKTTDSATAVDSPTEFLTWQLEALQNEWLSQDATGKPIIDPDLITPGYLISLTAADGVFDLWQERATAIQAKLDEIGALRAAAASEQAWLDSAFQNTLGVTGQALVDLNSRRSQGQEISADLENLFLSSGAFDFLLGIWQVAIQGQGLLESEAGDVINILVQAHKEKDLYSTWLQEEAGAGFVLGPAHFVLPDSASHIPPRESQLLPTWRASQVELNRWRNTLRSRIEQTEALREAISLAVDAAEEDALPGLREALILASGISAKQLTDDLLIDCQMESCAKTTRIAQAIETIQLLLWSVRTRQLDDSHPDLTLDDDYFDEAWKWLGSYETWRAAIFVFLYPENILLPNLRPRRTHIFQKIIDKTRSNRRLSPAKAGRLAHDYAAYLADVANLNIGASCYATARVLKEGPYQETIPAVRDYFYLFAHAEASGKVYWSTRDLEDDSGYAHSFWREVPGLENISGIVGADVYHISPTQRYVFLFATVEQFDRQRLVYTRLNLEQVPFRWDYKPTELDTPNDATSFEAVVVQSHNVDKSPELALEIPTVANTNIYWGRLVAEDFTGPQDWIVWKPLETNGSKKLLSAVGWGAEGVLVFSLWAGSGEVTVRFHPRFSGGAPFGTVRFPDSEDTESWQGAFLWPGVDNLAYAFWRSGGKFRYVPLWGPKKPQLPARPYAANFAGNLAYFAPHNTADSAASSKLTLAFQRSGKSGGPFHGTFERKPRLGVSFAINPASTRTEGTGSNGLSVLALRRDDGRFDSLAVDDIIIVDPLPPTDPLPPDDDDTDPPNLIKLETVEALRLAPRVDEPLDIVAPLSENEMSLRRVIIASTIDDNIPGPRSNLAYLQEAYYLVPMHLALQLQRSQRFIAALDWFRTVFDYSLPAEKRKIYYGLILEEKLGQHYERVADWLLDPLTPHNIAAQRRNAHTRFTVLSIVKCLLAYADQEFGRDTVESVARARILYISALELLTPADPQVSDCQAMIIDLDQTIGGDLDEDPGDWGSLWERYRDLLDDVADPGTLETVSGNIGTIWGSGDSIADRLARIELEVTVAIANEPEPRTMSGVLAGRKENTARAYALLQKRAGISAAIAGANIAVKNDLRRTIADVAGTTPDALGGVDLSWLGERSVLAETNAELLTAARARSDSNSRHSDTWSGLAEIAPLSMVKTNRSMRLSYVPGSNFQFCVPANPLLNALRRQIELNLYKIRSCRNIAGEVRDLEPYAAPIQIDAGLPTFEDGGRPFVRRRVKLPPTQYRYSTLIERAKQLVGHAQQLESAMLAILEKYDQESYRLMQARMDIRLSEAGLRLQQLRFRTAEINVRLAQLQHERARTQQAHYQQMINEGTSTAEILSLGAGWLGSFDSASGLGSFFSSMASLDRREQGWRQQQALARQDAKIGLFQIIAAGNERRVAGQQVDIAEMTLENTKATADFLVNKFTSAELYEWMSEVLERVYRFFLQQATAVARVAESQLAFERQKTLPPFVQSDYWDVPLGLGMGAADAPDRRGLTGSARLLQDLFQLDQYAFDTNERKLQMSKTISLALQSPSEFQRFRESGTYIFATPMPLFDHDFPGHYLRLIKKVSVSVIALIPPVAGIKATLSSSGLSKVVVAADELEQSFETIGVQRLPETIALTSPRDATGLFELTAQTSDLLLPFEDQGVDTSWEFTMSKAANQFDFNTIADVLFTIEYTALNNFDYRQQVLQQLDSTFSGERPFSFRQELADEWYDLNHPELVDDPTQAMIVTYETRRDDFAPNLDELRIEHVVLYFSRKEGSSFEVAASLTFTANNGNSAGGSATTIDGIISTRRGNGSPWLGMSGEPPVGTWTLDLTADLSDGRSVAEALNEEDIEDILFVITYSGITPERPN